MRLFALPFRRHESVTFSRISVQYAAFARARELHHDRFGSRRNNLRHAGARPRLGAGGGQGLQARRSGRFRDQAGGPDQERGRAGRPSRRRRLRTDADAAFKRNDFRTGLQILGQIAATAPEDSANWLRLARTIFQIQPVELQRADLPAGAGFDRGLHRLPARRQSRRRRPMRWPCSAKRCRSASCGGRRWTRCGCRSTCARSPTCAANMRRCATSTVSGCWITPWIRIRASPRACFQFSEDLAKRTDFAPFLALAGTDKPALSAEGKQLCVDGLKHGERYNINLRAGLPSTVKETLPKSAEFNIYVRDRKPFVRFTGRAYVLPRTGQRGIPVVSVNTPAVKVQRVPDRRPQPDQHGDRQRLPAIPEQVPAFRPRRRARRQGLVGRTCHRDDAEPGRHDGVSGRSGARRSAAGRLCDDRCAERAGGSDDDGQLATQWFIVSDMGLTAFSGNDGIHVFVNSLASTEAVANAEVRLIARNNEILATRKTDDVRSCAVRGRAGARRGRSCRRRC